MAVMTSSRALKIAFDAYLTIASSYDRYSVEGIAEKDAEGKYKWDLGEEIRRMDKILWNCLNVPMPEPRVERFPEPLVVQRPVLINVAPLVPGGGEFHVDVTNDHPTLPLRFCVLDLGNPRLVHVKRRPLPVDLQPGERTDFDAEVIDTDNFTDAYFEFTFCWRNGDPKTGGNDVGRAPGTWPYFVAQRVIMWDCTKRPFAPYAEPIIDLPGPELPGDTVDVA